jgi:hypothetical protein
MNLEHALSDLSNALGADTNARDRLRIGRQVLTETCLKALGVESPAQLSWPGLMRLVVASPDRPAQRDCAVLLLHALAIPNLLPPAADCEVCALVETALRTALLRCGYPFGASLEEKIRVLRNLPARIGELMEPLQPTFPNWQGLYAG